MIEPGRKYYFSEPFQSQLISAIKDAEARAEARANGKYVAPVGEPAPTKNQKAFLTRRGVAIPATKREASEKISAIKRRM